MSGIWHIKWYDPPLRSSILQGIFIACQNLKWHLWVSFFSDKFESRIYWGIYFLFFVCCLGMELGDESNIFIREKLINRGDAAFLFRIPFAIYRPNSFALISVEFVYIVSNQDNFFIVRRYRQTSRVKFNWFIHRPMKPWWGTWSVHASCDDWNNLISAQFAFVGKKINNKNVYLVTLDVGDTISVPVCGLKFRLSIYFAEAHDKFINSLSFYKSGTRKASNKLRILFHTSQPIYRSQIVTNT